MGVISRYIKTFIIIIRIKKQFLIRSYEYLSEIVFLNISHLCYRFSRLYLLHSAPVLAYLKKILVL